MYPVVSAMSNGRGDLSDVAGPDVADGEHTRQTGFEEMRRSGERPLSAGQFVLGEIGSCLEEAFENQAGLTLQSE
jgi:hypothetical protein